MHSPKYSYIFLPVHLYKGMYLHKTETRKLPQNNKTLHLEMYVCCSTVISTAIDSYISLFEF